MASLSRTQLAWRGRIETGLRIVAPALDLLLLAGDRISRVADRDALDSPPPARRVGERAESRLAGPPESA
jgi:hypothetical protein